jgi:hypothetical protein
MKKIFAVLSLIAVLMVAFTSQAVANDNVDNKVEFVNSVTLDVAFVEVSVFKPDLTFHLERVFSKNVTLIISNSKTFSLSEKNLPIEVGLITKFSNYNIETLNSNKSRTDIPFKVGWSNK